MAAISRAESGSTGAFEMSWFHGLSGGNICLPCRLALGPRLGAGPGGVDAETVRGRVTGVGVGTPGKSISSGRTLRGALKIATCTRVSRANTTPDIPFRDDFPCIRNFRVNIFVERPLT